MSTKSRARDWLRQARDDLRFAKAAINLGFYSQVCYISQQAGEKAIKAIAYDLEYEVKGHSIFKIAQQLGINGDVEKAAKSLDLYYISARYPDALPAGAPCDFLGIEEAEEAYLNAEVIIKSAIAELGEEN